ncbi:MAG: 3-deoxy-7-phosphoheptulonate synthase [bacterium]
MYIHLKKNINKKEKNEVIKQLKEMHFEIDDVSTKEEGLLFINQEVELPHIHNVVKVTRDYFPYRNSSILNELVSIKVKDIVINRDTFTIIAGPCSVESNEQIKSIVDDIKDNMHILRGGAFKPRTSPFEFQGLKMDGLEILKQECQNKPIITEITSVDDIKYFEQNVDIIQVGARNMQNFDLLKKLGKVSKPILLKRGLSNTIHEWLSSAEYIMSGGNKQVILCERGIRTFENFTRNTLDLSAVVAVKEISCLPVIVDPSHAAGKYWMIEKLTKAALAVGADGIMIEVHNDPENALSDGPQSIKPKDFNKIIEDVKVLAPHFNKKVM